MTGAAVAVPSSTDAFVRPYVPSWVNDLIAWVDRLPGPRWAFYIGLMAVGGLASMSSLWIPGAVPVGQFAISQVYWGLLPGALLWLTDYLDGVAHSAFDAFRPALETSEANAARLGYELTVIPARWALVLTIFALLFQLAGYLLDPVGSQVVGLSAFGFAVRIPVEWLVSSLMIVILYHTLRQLRAVSRIHELARHVDLLQPAPLYAFSSLTSRTGIALIAIISTAALTNPESMLSSFGFPFVVAFFVVAVLAFVVPLYGMHQRIAAERARLLSEVGRRLTASIAEIHRSSDAADLSQADALNKMLTSLIAEREMTARLPAWPWQPGTLGAFATAIVLPIGLFLATRFLDRII